MAQSLVQRSPEETGEVLNTLEAEFPDLEGQLFEDGRIRISLKGRPACLWVDYEEVTPQSGSDPWRYSLSHATLNTEHAGTFSHPAEKGCWIMARKYFAENGLLPVPMDNSHLSNTSLDICLEAEIQRTRRGQRATWPETGDFIRDQSGDLRRVCHCYDDRCQTTTALERSYSTCASGYASYSGSLGSSVNYSDLIKAKVTRKAMFWIFRDGIAGAGRGVELWLDVRVWDFSGVFGDGLWWGR